MAHHVVFDMKFLCKDFSKYHMWNELKARVSGIINTLPIFRELYSGLESYKLVALAKIFAGEVMESTHNAMDDCEMLRNMLSCSIIFLLPQLASQNMKEKILKISFGDLIDFCALYQRSYLSFN